MTVLLQTAEKKLAWILCVLVYEYVYNFNVICVKLGEVITL